MKKITLFFTIVILVLSACKDSADPFSKNWDICIYGGTSAGVIAAYSAKMMGLSVILIEPGTHLGGLTAGIYRYRKQTCGNRTFQRILPEDGASL
jgi:NADPH-dependent 2,4-dienoyl-CoA reductase/sulfur reductase-like enzyme